MRPRKAALLISLFFLFPFLFISCNGQKSVRAVEELACRISPELAETAVFRIIDRDSSDYYRFFSEKNRIVFEGNNANSLAKGLGDYLKDFCRVTVTPYRRDRVELPAELPLPSDTVTVRAIMKDRFFLNYCTFGYSLNWFKWEDWERLIDWMALNGVNMAMANTGQESVWMNVWKEYGLDESQIREYFTGPSYLAWHRMVNIDKWGSPLPYSWLDGQCKLQKKIISREKSLGIDPILSCFTGHVPEALKKIWPDADINRLRAWSGFGEEFSVWQLSASDELYGRIQKSFLKEQKRMYGQDCHIYAIDLFNEVEPLKWDADYLKETALLTYRTISEVDKDAIWLQMSWLFFHNRRWTPELIEAYISHIPKGRLVMLDYFCDQTEIYRKTDNFYGQDFIWSFLGNFGGRTVINGDLKSIGQKLDSVVVRAPKECVGVGCTLEGLGVNMSACEYVLSRGWERNGDDSLWIEKLADRHIGYPDAENRQAWATLYGKVLKGVMRFGTFMTARPSLTPKARWSRKYDFYDNRDLLEAWRLLISAKPSDSPAYRFDCVNFARQCLSNHFASLYFEVLEAYSSRDADRIAGCRREMLEIISDIDTLVGSDSYFLLGKWIEDARSWGINEEEKNYYETDARRILTTWGEKGRMLVDYANREYNGLLSTYYAPRWEKFLTMLENDVRAGRPFDEEAFLEWSTSFEWDWATMPYKFRSRPEGDPYSLSREMLEKYFPSDVGIQ